MKTKNNIAIMPLTDTILETGTLSMVFIKSCPHNRKLARILNT